MIERSRRAWNRVVTRCGERSIATTGAFMRAEFRILAVVVLLAALGASACGGKHEAAPPPPPEVVVAPVEAKDVAVHSEWVGTTDGSVNAQIRARVQGYLESQNYAEGTLVKP